MLSDREIRRRFGPGVPISRKDGFVLIHLDRPSRRQIRLRTRDFDPSTYFDADCPLCALQRASGLVIFDSGCDGNTDEIWLE